MSSCVDDVSLKLVSEGKVVDRQGICTMPLNVVWSRIRFLSERQEKAVWLGTVC